MFPTSPSEQDEHRRKRVRKGTKSCWECKRRKIRCQLSSEDVSVCAACITRGTSCLSQEYPEVHDTPSGNQIGERLGRVEILLEKLVSKIDEYDEEKKVQNCLQTPESMGGNDDLALYASNNSTNEDAPILSLFNNPVIGHRQAAVQSQSLVASPQGSGIKTPSCMPTKIDRLRQTLIDLLPTQKDADVICKASSCWLLMYISRFQNPIGKDPSIMVSTFNLNEVRKQHPTVIARTLLHISICLQQLLHGFDSTLLSFGTSIQSRIDRYISTVQALITSDDELVSTVGGLECLILLGAFQINHGNPRRAWLTFRRALNTAQLLGLHKKDTPISGGREKFFHIVQVDRYLGLLLGLPCGSTDDISGHGEFGPDETFQNPAIDKEVLFMRKLSQISGSVIERNQKNDNQTYAATQEIDERLDQLAKELPTSWWAVPVDLPTDQSLETAAIFERFMMQIWYFQLQAFLHLPFMLRAATERRYEYSKFSCLKASREMMYRYVALREPENQMCCKVVDFSALIATVTLLLDLLELPQAGESQNVWEQKESDRTLVRNVMNSMENLGRNGGDILAKQCSNVIKALLSADSPADSNSGNLRLTIPYFGTVNIARPPANPSQNQSSTLMPIQPQQSMPTNQQHGMQDWQGIPFSSQHAMNGPVVSFTSSQFPAQLPDHQIEGWGLEEADTLFFDSLLSTDIDGNWVF